MIEIKNVSKSFDKPILDNVNIQIPDGSIVGLVGINGVGKSTFLRIITGVFEPDTGCVLYDGRDISTDEKIKRDIFYIPDNPSFKRLDTPFSLKEDYRFWFNQLTYDVEFMKHLREFHIPFHGLLHKFSKGMKRQTLLALGVSLAPKYLFLDEAFDGVDPLARKELKKVLLENQERTNSTIILSSHSLRELEDICDTYLIVDNGKVHEYHNILDFNYHKYVMAFDTNYNESDFKIDFVSFDRDNKIITCVTNLDYEHMLEKIQPFNPKIIEELSMNVEESFITKITKEENK